MITLTPAARRALRYLANDFIQMLPIQAFRCILGRDYARVMTSRGARHDAEQALLEREENEEVSEPTNA